MADKIAKLLAKLPPKQLRLLKLAVAQIVSGDLAGLDVKAMAGHGGLFRVRVGDYRIIFRQHAGEEPNIISISRRNEKTYRGL